MIHNEHELEVMKERLTKMERMLEERIIREKGSLEEGDFISNDTLCRQVSNREPQLKNFASQHDVVVFVSGKKSSNGKDPKKGGRQ